MQLPVEGGEEGERRLTWRGLFCRPVVVLSVLFSVCALLRLGLLERHGLWADELFSLALTTGHSLEHPAGVADPAWGDYVEAPEALPPSAYSRYLEHESPPAGPARVVRALLLSDASPPLYYLLLYGWTLALGTSDGTLRLFSVAWALACFPVIGSLARQLGGRPAVLPACALFAFAPLCVFYSTEGRMYSLLWFWSASTLWLALDLWQRGPRSLPFGLWVAAAVAGLLTHYFFSFVWAALLAGLLLRPGLLKRRYVGAGAILSALLVLPWYLHVPESLEAWRLTGYWLKDRPGDYHPVWTLVRLPWSYFSTDGMWGASRSGRGVSTWSFSLP
jgi:Dolichyl-phosphate-mannose-protein mannosyltransferase